MHLVSIPFGKQRKSRLTNFDTGQVFRSRDGNSTNQNLHWNKCQTIGKSLISTQTCLTVNFLLPFIHLKSNSNSFSNLQIFKFHGQCFSLLKRVLLCKASNLLVITKIKKKVRETKTMSKLALKIVPPFQFGI